MSRFIKRQIRSKANKIDDTFDKGYFSDPTVLADAKDKGKLLLVNPSLAQEFKVPLRKQIKIPILKSLKKYDIKESSRSVG